MRKRLAASEIKISSLSDYSIPDNTPSLTYRLVRTPDLVELPLQNVVSKPACLKFLCVCARYQEVGTVV